MYLSRVEVDLNNRQKTKDLTHLGAYHNWVEQSFPEEIDAGVRRRHLWRLDPLKNKTYLLVLSEKEPDKDKLAHYGVADSVMTKSYDNLLDSLRVGQHLRFRLTANPTHSVPLPGEKRGHVYPYLKLDEQRQWLIDKAAKGGFSFLSQTESELGDFPTFDIVKREHEVVRRKRERNIQIIRVSFEGVLEIQDLSKFKATLTMGVGREKAFGMGLLTVIPEV